MQRSLLLAGCLVLCVNLFSQKIRFDQSFGLGANIADISGVNNFFDTTGKPVLSEYTVRVKKFGIVYTPRIDLLGTKDVSLSIKTAHSPTIRIPDLIHIADLLKDQFSQLHRYYFFPGPIRIRSCCQWPSSHFSFSSRSISCCTLSSSHSSKFFSS
jgi:hypothetical protein